MKAIFLLALLLGAAAANDIPLYDQFDKLGFVEHQPEPTGEPVTVQSRDEEWKTTMEPITSGSTASPKLSESEHPLEYTAGRTYLYNYWAQILTGNPEMSKQFVGYQMRCRVRLVMWRNRRVHMRLENIQFKQTNRILPMRRPMIILPYSYFESLPNSQDFTNIVRLLQMPVSFLWTPTGWVKDIRVSKGDTFWSLNIKKGLMTMLNINMLNIWPSDINQKINGIFKRTKYFEDGIDGQCKTNYEYSRYAYNVRIRRRPIKLIKVTKTRDLDDCKSRPWFNHMLFLPTTCSKSRNPLYAKTKTDYTMAVAGRGYFIRQITTNSEYSFTETDVKEGAVYSYVTQHLRFARAHRQATELLTSVEAVPHRKGLSMVIPSPEWARNKRDNPKLLVAAKVQAIQILKKYIRDDLDMYENMRNFIHIVRRLTKNDILKLIKHTQSSPEMTRVKNKDILHSILSKVATKEVAEAIVEIIKRRSLPDDTTAMLVSRLSGMSFVSSGRMIKQMMVLAERMRLPKQKETYKSLLFVIGKLINTHYLMPIPMPPGHTDAKLTRMEIERFYTKLLSRRSLVLSPKLYKMTVLSSLGNCGLVRPCLPLIEPYLKPRHNDRRPIPRVVRMAAFYALLDVAPRAPMIVRGLVMPTLSDVREDTELRIAAYEVFMATRPGLSDLKLVSQFVTKEPVKQLRSFIATHLHLLSQCKDRCLAPLALNASRVVRELPAELVSPDGLQFSRLMGMRLPMWEKIALVYGSWKFTPKSFLPRQVDVGLLARALGLNIEMGRVIVRAEDAQRLLSRLLGPYGTVRTMRSLQSLLRPITGRSKIDTDYIAGLVMHKGVYSMTGLSKEVTDTLKKGLIPVPRDIYRLAVRGAPLERRLETLNYFDQVSKFPTAIGMPISFNNTITTHLKIKANVRVNPKLLSRMGTLGMRVKLGASYRHELRAGPDMTILSSYVCAMRQGHLPRATAGIKVGWINPKATPRQDRVLFRVNVERPKEDKKILHWSGHLVTALWSQAQPNKPQKKHMQHQTLPKPWMKTKRVVTCKSLGLALDYQYRVLNFTGLQPSLKMPFFAPCDIKVIMRRNTPTADDRGIDFAFQLFLKRKNLQSIFTGSMNDTMNDDLQSSTNSTLWEENVEGDNEPRPTGEPLQMLKLDDSDSENLNSSHAFFSESSSEEELERPSNSTDQPDILREMDEEQRKTFLASQRRLQSGFLQVVMRLAKMPLSARPIINLSSRGAIWRMQLSGKVLRRNIGISWTFFSHKFRPRTQIIHGGGYVVANKAIMRTRFVESQPLKIINNMRLHTGFHISMDRKLVFNMNNVFTMGGLWKRNMRRIILNKNKELRTFRAIKRCQLDIKRRLFGTPACYQAWKDINALSKMRSTAYITKYAPQWLKQSAVVAFNLLRQSQSEALWVSKYVDAPSGKISITGDWQLSPYDQKLVAGYQTMLKVMDYYVNARLLLTRRNSVVESPAANVLLNAFDKLYPARCEVVRRGAWMTWRTFDKVERYARSKLASHGGRVVLLQDIKKRLLVTEQRSRSHRITHIRLRWPWQHVLIVVRRNSRFPVARVFYRGRLRRLPFKLYNRRRQIVLAVYREPTPRSRFSVTATMPLAGCTVKTNPAVSTEIGLSPFYHSNVRGICGDFSGEKWNDGKGPTCHAVFPYSQSYLWRHTQILRRMPTLKQIERISSMRRFIRVAQCPDRRYYPLIL